MQRRKSVDCCCLGFYRDYRFRTTVFGRRLSASGSACVFFSAERVEGFRIRVGDQSVHHIQGPRDMRQQ